MTWVMPVVVVSFDIALANGLQVSLSILVSVMLADLWALIKGLQYVWDQGLRKGLGNDSEAMKRLLLLGWGWTAICKAGFCGRNKKVENFRVKETEKVKAEAC
ncbi:hypothetical protein RIF29_33423 [Crotalaria pallida]|uniref:Uncharacterized protein n=1 Tax=Crotalaria pallida TaxID=3830 RepID=A0AAN9HWT3_CROPI